MDKLVPNLGEIFKADQIDELRRAGSASEQLGQLTPSLLQIIYANKWFKLFVPRAHGGMELALPDAVRMEEALAWVDGSLGWTVTLCAGASWFAGFFPESLSRSLFTPTDACLAGSGMPGGMAEISGDGYLIKGYWKYASGAVHATAFTASCLVFKEGIQQLDSQGQPLVRAFLFYRDEVEVHPTWHSIGLVATASHAFEVRNLFVPRERCFEINHPMPWANQSLYHFPFLQLAEATLAINICGMTIHFLDLFGQLIEKKELSGADPRKGNRETFLAQAWDRVMALRQQFYNTLERSWTMMLETSEIPEDLLGGLSDSSRQLATHCRRETDELYPLAGLAAADRSAKINRVWRDLHTASQHSLLI